MLLGSSQDMAQIPELLEGGKKNPGIVTLQLRRRCPLLRRSKSLRENGATLQLIDRRLDHIGFARIGFLKGDLQRRRHRLNCWLTWAAGLIGGFSASHACDTSASLVKNTSPL